MTNAEINKKTGELMGWAVSVNPRTKIVTCVVEGREVINWNPAEDIGDAWKLVEFIKSKDMTVTMIINSWGIGVFINNQFTEEETAPKAICQAFIKLEGK